MPELVPQQAPPPDYYARNLRTVLTHVRAFYGDLLEIEEQRYFSALLGVSVAAQRLYARLLGRRGPWIRIDKLNYVEINDLDQAIDELESAALVAVNEPAPADALLGLLTEAERKALYPEIKGVNKARWISGCVGRYQDVQIQRRLAEAYPWICVSDYQTHRLCELLFFGDDHQDTSAFVLQDLGMVRYEDYVLDPQQRQFDDRSALDRYRLFRKLSHLSHRIGELPALANWLAEALWLPGSTRLEQRQKDRTLNRLAHWYERSGAFDEALACYARSRTHPSRERRTRILKKLKDTVGAAQLIDKIRAEPRCAEEQDFANRFGRKRQRLDHEITEIPLRANPEGSIEQHAAALLGAGGAAVFHLENRFPLGLAGLAFWEVIFEPVPGTFVNPFQSGPLDLFWPDFAETRRQQLCRRQAQLRDPDIFARSLRATYRAKAGTANRLVSWHHFTESVLEAVLQNIPHDALLALANHVIEQPYRTRTGFPDLVVIYGPNNFEFVEVKGPTDQLQPAQRIWLQAFARLDQRARVLKFKAC